MMIVDAHEVGRTYDCRVGGCPGVARYQDGLCSWHDANGAPGEIRSTTSKRKETTVAQASPWTEETVVVAIKLFHQKHGYTPTINDSYALSSGAKKVFGSWGAAIEAAGFPRPTRGGKRRRPAETNGGVAAVPPPVAAEPGTPAEPAADEPAAAPGPQPFATGSLQELAVAVDDARVAADSARADLAWRLSELRAAVEALVA